MKPRNGHALAILVNLASGSTLVLLAVLVADLGPLPALGWWAVGSGLVLATLTFPSWREVRDSLLPGALAALTFGAAAFALDAVGPTLVGLFVVLALALAPALYRLLHLGMPSPLQLGALSGGVLGLVILVSLGTPEPGTLLVVIAGLACTGHIVATDRVMHRNRIVGLHSATMLVAGGLLLASAFSTSGVALPAPGRLPVLVASVLLAGVALPLARVRSAQRLSPPLARHHLPWFVVGAVLAGWWSAPLSTIEATAAAVLLASAWLAGGTPSGVTEAESFRIGP